MNGSRSMHVNNSPSLLIILTTTELSINKKKVHGSQYWDTRPKENKNELHLTTLHRQKQSKIDLKMLNSQLEIPKRLSLSQISIGNFSSQQGNDHTFKQLL